MDNRLIRKTKYGYVKGTSNEYADVFNNIPYAKPPLGDLMFKHPVEPDKYEGVLDCTKGGVNPVQHMGKFGVPNQSLDCLQAYIFIPKRKKGPLPVMFWIYGGAYSNGGVGVFNENNELYYDMSLFASETNTVVVAFNYRINIYGFLNLTMFGDKFDFNNGLMDQLLALKFTKDNIANFEGDPNNITIIGQSAGAASVLSLMSMEEANGLYNKAIVESPCVDHYLTIEESEKLTKKFLSFAKIKDSKELFSIEKDRLYKAIEKSLNWFLLSGDARCFFSPVIDGKVLKDYPYNRINNSKVPMLIGYTTNESDMFVDEYPTIALPFVKMMSKAKLGNEKESYRYRLSDALTRLYFIDPIEKLVGEYNSPAYLYEFTHKFEENKRAYHAVEVILMVTQKDHVGAKQIRKIFSDFAYTSNPGWETYNATKRKFILK